MIDPATSWFEMSELPVTDDVSPNGAVQNKCPEKNISTKTKEAYFDKSLIMISKLVNKCWFSRYPRCKNIIFDDGSESKLHFKTLCESYRVKPKPISIKKPQTNAILEQIHQVIMTMVCTSEINMADSVAHRDIDTILTNASWAICSTYHMVLSLSRPSNIWTGYVV